MAIQLFLSLDGLNYYGDVPEVPKDPIGIVEEYPLSTYEYKIAAQ